MYKLIFISNYYNNHTIDLIESFNDVYNGSFLALETTGVEEYRKRIGWKKIEREFISDYQNHYQDVLEAQVVIYSGIVDKIIAKRIKSSKLTFLVTERPYKVPTTLVTYPKRWLGSLLHFKMHQCDNFYLLAIGGYVKDDMKLFNNFVNKIFKWAYFPKILIEPSIPIKSNDLVKFVWSGRFEKLKRPQHAINILNIFVSKGINCALDMYGEGDEMQNLIIPDNLVGCIRFHGFVDGWHMQQAFKDADVLLMSSDRNEGWGAIINEAMFHYCTVIASDTVGATTYLIKQKYNGFIYNDVCDVSNYVEVLLNNLETLKINAHNTIETLWNAKIASQRFKSVADAILSHNEIPLFDKGPMSWDNF